MSIRTYKRYQLHVQARREGAKEGPYVRKMWDRYQEIRYGAAGRAANQEVGTKPKKKWRPGLCRAFRRAQ